MHPLPHRSAMASALSKARPWLFALLLVLAASLAGCGTPDEQESDENEASEQGNVGEGEVPGFGLAAAVAGVALAAFLFTRRA